MLKKNLLLGSIDKKKKKKKYTLFGEVITRSDRNNDTLCFFDVNDANKKLGIKATKENNESYYMGKDSNKYILFRNNKERVKKRMESFKRQNKVYVIVIDDKIVYNLKVHNSHLTIGLTGSSVIHNREITFKGKRGIIKDPELLKNVIKLKEPSKDDNYDIPFIGEKVKPRRKKMGRIIITKKRVDG